MKSHHSYLALACLFVGLMLMPLQGLYAATSLAAGDLAIIGIDTDDEEFTFVTFVDIDAGTEIYFTDEEGNASGSGFLSGEGFLRYVVPGGGLSAGDVIHFTGTGGDWTQVQGSFALSNSGDGVWAFQDSDTNFSTVTTMIHFAGEDDGDRGNPDLGVLYSNDNGNYTGVRTGTAADLLSAINNSSNWSTSGSPITLTTSAFSVSSNATTPTVTTTAASSIAIFSADSGGNVTDDGGASVTERGIVYATSSNPTTSDNKLADGSTGEGSFSASITGLSASTTYYVRAYAINSQGTSYGSNESFTTSAFVTAATDVENDSFTANWNTVSGATSYELIVDDDSDFSSPVINADVGNVTSKAITGLSGGNTYYYKVRYLNNSGSASSVVNFESAGDGYTPSTTTGSGTTDVFNRTNDILGNNDGYYWAMEDIPVADPYITLDAIDVTGLSSVDFSIDMLTPNSIDWDIIDEMKITYSLDGGASQNLMWVQSVPDGDDYNAPAALDLAFDGDGDAGQELPAITDGASAGVGNTFETFTKTNIDVSGSNSMVITISITELDASDEGIYLDNITVSWDSSFTSDYSSSVTLLTTPDAPGSVSATDGSSLSQVDLSWSDSGVSEEGGYTYDVYRHTSNSFGSASTITTGLAGGTESYTDSSATPGALYYYWVVGTNGTGDGETSSSDAGYVKLTTPSWDKADSANASGFTINWTPPSSSDIDDYTLKISTSSDMSSPSTETPSSNSYTYSGSENAYFVTIAANNDDTGSSDISDVYVIQYFSVADEAKKFVAPMSDAGDTLEEVFGSSNEAGLAEGSVSTATLVNKISSGSSVAYRYSSGWKDASNGDASNVSLKSGEAVYFENLSGSTDYIVISGDKRTGAGPSIGISAGAYNLLVTGWSTDMRLDQMGLDPGAAGGFKHADSSVPMSASDVIILLDDAGNLLQTYYYVDWPAGHSRTDGWYSGSRALSDSVTIAPGQPFYMKLQSDSGQGAWTSPVEP